MMNFIDMDETAECDEMTRAAALVHLSGDMFGGGGFCACSKILVSHSAFNFKKGRFCQVREYVKKRNVKTFRKTSMP